MQPVGSALKAGLLLNYQWELPGVQKEYSHPSRSWIIWTVPWYICIHTPTPNFCSLTWSPGPQERVNCFKGRPHLNHNQSAGELFFFHSLFLPEKIAERDKMPVGWSYFLPWPIRTLLGPSSLRKGEFTLNPGSLMSLSQLQPPTIGLKLLHAGVKPVFE